MLHCGTFQLTARSDGKLLLPPLLSKGLSLVPGDILFIECGPRAHHLRIYRELLALHQEVADPENRWAALAEIFSKIPTAIDEHGYLVIPPEALKVEEGETLVLHVYRAFGIHGMFLYWPRPAEPSHFIRMEILTKHVSLN